MKINDIIKTLEIAMRMEPDVKRLSHDVSVANDAYNCEKAGLNRTLTRLRLADAEKALAEKRADLEAVYATLPPKESIQYAEFCRRVAQQRIRHGELEMEKAAAEAELATLQTASKANEWKWKARGEPPNLVLGRKKLAGVEEQLAALALQTAEDEVHVREETEFEEYTAELTAWTPGSPLPERFRRAEAEQIRQMEMEMEAIPLPKRHEPYRIPRLVVSELEE